VLKEDTHGYGAEGRAPQGRCVIEARGSTGRVSVYVQDLKPMMPYKALLVKRGDDKSYGVSLGSVEVGANRRCEVSFDINTDNVGGFGFPVEQYDTVAVIVNDGRVHIPLSDSRGNDGRWKSNLVMEAPERQEPEQEDVVTQAVEIPDPEDKDAESEEAETVVSDDADAVMPFVSMAEYKEPVIYEEAVQTEDIPEEVVEEAEPSNKMVENPHETFKEIIHKLNKELSELAEIAAPTEIDALQYEALENTPSPFDGDQSGWKHITMHDFALLPINMFDYEQKAIISAAFYKHGPLIITDAPENAQGKYILGVPGIFSPEDSKGYRQLGFFTFRGKDGTSGPGAEGYWLKEI